MTHVVNKMPEKTRDRKYWFPRFKSNWLGTFRSKSMFRCCECNVDKTLKKKYKPSDGRHCACGADEWRKAKQVEEDEYNLRAHLSKTFGGVRYDEALLMAQKAGFKRNADDKNPLQRNEKKRFRSQSDFLSSSSSPSQRSAAAVKAMPAIHQDLVAEPFDPGFAELNDPHQGYLQSKYQQAANFSFPTTAQVGNFQGSNGTQYPPNAVNQMASNGLPGYSAVPPASSCPTAVLPMANIQPMGVDVNTNGYSHLVEALVDRRIPPLAPPSAATSKVQNEPSTPANVSSPSLDLPSNQYNHGNSQSTRAATTSVKTENREPLRRQRSGYEAGPNTSGPMASTYLPQGSLLPTSYTNPASAYGLYYGQPMPQALPQQKMTPQFYPPHQYSNMPQVPNPNARVQMGSQIPHAQYMGLMPGYPNQNNPDMYASNSTNSVTSSTLQKGVDVNEPALDTKDGIRESFSSASAPVYDVRKSEDANSLGDSSIEPIAWQNMNNQNDTYGVSTGSPETRADIINTLLQDEGTLSRAA